MENMKNFGKIKNAFNNILVEGLLKKDDTKKELFKKYVKTVKENEILKTQFLVYSNIETKYEPNVHIATDFVKENIELFSKFDKKSISDANLNLAEPILFEQSDSKYVDEKLHDAISTLISTKKTPTNIDSILESQHYVVNYIMNNKVAENIEKVELPNSMISTILVDRYNEKYNSLDENDRKVLKVINDSNDDQRKEVYSNTLRECIDLIDIKLKDADLESKDKLLRVKDKLLNDKKEINEEFISNISKLIELKSSLKTN